MVTPARSERLASDDDDVRSFPGEVARAIFRRREEEGEMESWQKNPSFPFSRTQVRRGRGGKERFLGSKREKEQGEKYTGEKILLRVFPVQKLEIIAPKMNKKVDEFIFRFPLHFR